jgi:hypothetical protein
MLLVLLVATGLLIGWVGFRTVRASGDASARGGLDYQTFLEALDDLIREAGDSTLLVFHQVEAEIAGGRSVVYDTIAITADVRAFPAFDRAGFLYDQVQAYNHFQRERLALARVAPEWFQRLKPYNPSVFRRARGGKGTGTLSRASSAWSLRVPSPLEGEWRGEVRAWDVRRGRGLLSTRVAVPLGEATTLARRVQGRSQLCQFVPRAAEVRAYCLSEERIPQAIFRLPPEGRGPGWAVPGWDDLWVDGNRIRPGDSVEISHGTLLRLNPLEPLVFADYWEGVLSSRQWINGRMRRRLELPQPLDLLAALGRGPARQGTEASPTASIRLSVRADASEELTRLLQRFLETELDVPLDVGMIVLARVPEGEIVALAETGERSTRGRSPLLERVAPGSAVKPLLAAAVLSQRPELAELRLPARSGRVSSVLNLPPVSPRRAFSTALNCAVPGDGAVDLPYFLRCSNNEYAASLVMAGLAGGEQEDGAAFTSLVAGGSGAERKPGEGGASGIPVVGGRVPRGVLLHSPLARGLSRLFGHPTDPTIADSIGRSTRPWKGLTYSDGTPAAVPFEVLPAESRPALLAPGSTEGTELGLLYRYAFGAWENRWTLLDLTRGFARVVTDRPVELRFFGGGGPGHPGGGGFPGTRTAPAESEPGSLGLARHDWYASFLAGLRGVATDGTARGLRRAWEADGLSSLVFAKTGTLDEPGEPGPLDDLFAKSLLFAVGKPPPGQEATDGGPLGCGLVGGIYLRFSREPPSGTLPSHQVEFARRELGGFLREHWEELGGCR